MVFTISRKTFNDFHLGLCFTVLNASTKSITHIQQMFFNSIHQDNPVYNVNGYASLGLTYACTSLATFIAPSVVSMIGWKPTLLIGAVSFNYFVLYYFESNWLTYLGTILYGFGEGFLWLSEAMYMILNSEIKSTTQSIGIFWAFYESSYFIGNAVVYFMFNENEDPYLNQSMRREIIAIFACIVVCAIIMISLLRNPIRQDQVDKLGLTPLGEIKSVYQTIKSRDTLLYNFIYIFCGEYFLHILINLQSLPNINTYEEAFVHEYTFVAGLNYSFLSVLASSLGFTKYLSNNSKTYAPLSGVIQGAGEIIGVILTAWLGRKSIFKLRAIPIACIVSTMTYIMVFLALPRSSAFSYTDEKPLMELPIYILMIGNVAIGFGDACMQTGIYNYIGYIHPHKCAPSLAHFKFIRNITSAASFYCSSHLDLQIQTAILTLFSILAFCAFYGSWNNSYSSDDEKVSSARKFEK